MKTSEITLTADNEFKCLIVNSKQRCKHHNCSLAQKKPQYFGISIKEWYNRYQFDNFELIASKFSRPFLIPHDTVVGCIKDFVSFRAAMNSVTLLAGKWPSRLKLIPRDHVEFRWAEFEDNYFDIDPETGENLRKKRKDVMEFAFYIGPLAAIELNQK